MTRIAAWRILRSGTTTPLRAVDRAAARRSFDARDRGLLRRLVGTEVRRRGTLRALVSKFARGKPSADVSAHLRLGLLQLFFLDRVPPFAALSETVDATRRTLGAGPARTVNAILRNALRARRSGASGDPRRDLVLAPWHFDEPIFRDPAQHVALWAEDALSLPAALAKRWIRRLGEQHAFALGRAFLNESPASLRVVHGEPSELAEELVLAGLDPTPGHHPRTLRLPAGAIESVLATPAFERGALAVQGETALAAADLVGAEAGMRVLEVCAAPGGKTCVLAGAGADVTALDLSLRRISRLPAELARVRAPGHVRIVVSDSTHALGPATFDAVLVDAPCSNTGVLGNRPGARWRFGPAQQRALALLQSRLLDDAADHVRPGGRLVYSTCSLEPEENSRAVQGLLERRPDFELEEEREALPAGLDPDGALASGPIDGGYAARLTRRSNP